MERKRKKLRPKEINLLLIKAKEEKTKITKTWNNSKKKNSLINKNIVRVLILNFYFN